MLQQNDNFNSAVTYQKKASSPSSSAWVSANAGSGKTHLLVSRIIRLLLEDNECKPHQILCLTYTKSAAENMKTSLFLKLADWAILKDDELLAELKNISDRAYNMEELAKARSLFTRLLETAHSLKIQTIHSFCESLLHRFPIEANVPAGFSIIEDAKRYELINNAKKQVISRAAFDTGSIEGMALKLIAFEVNDKELNGLFDSIIKERNIFQILEGFLAGEKEPIYDDFLINRFGFEIFDKTDDYKINFFEKTGFQNDYIDKIIKAYSCSTSSSDIKTQEILLLSKSEKEPIKKFDLLLPFFLTQSHGMRKKLATKKVADKNPFIIEKLLEIQSKYHQAVLGYNASKIAKANQALMILSKSIIDIYEKEKQTKLLLDYDDLIYKTKNLLIHSDDRMWVLYKLDGGINHILVDEAQDTSLEQWEIIASLCEEFFLNSGNDDRAKSLLVVGDEKQSIYSFQGAEPDNFIKKRNELFNEAKNSQKLWQDVPLITSFRSSPTILKAVDLIFKNPKAQAGMGSVADNIKHNTIREDVGYIELWPLIEVASDDSKADYYAPVDKKPEDAPEKLLANKIAIKIAAMLKKDEQSLKGVHITAGDILILVRRRGVLFDFLISALKKHNIPLAGADRMELLEQTAVTDLIALGNFTLNPHDDFNLAVLLKSPLINLSEEELLELAINRTNSLFNHIKAIPQSNAKFTDISKRLSYFLKLSKNLSPHAFYSQVLAEIEELGLLRNMLNRLGHEALEPIDEFLNQIEIYEKNNYPTMQGFTLWLENLKTKIKRDMEQSSDKVRIMTIHGAKGLEAPIVILPDTTTIPDDRLDKFVNIPYSDEEILNISDIPIWKVPGKKLPKILDDNKDQAKNSILKEYNRLLYVALTRARDMLIICGAKGKRDLPDNCWYKLIEEGLQDHLINKNGKLANCHDNVDEKHNNDDFNNNIKIFNDDDNDNLLINELSDDNIANDKSVSNDDIEIPQWCYSKIDNQNMLEILIPSQIELDNERNEKPYNKSLFNSSPFSQKKQNRYKRGLIIHKLFELLPDIHKDKRYEAAKKYLSEASLNLTTKIQIEILDEVFAILNNHEYSEIFSENSFSEVPITGKIKVKMPQSSNKSKFYHISGNIDRLVIKDDEIIIIDYKSMRPNPNKVEDTPKTYINQLKAYQSILKDCYQDKNIRTMILWTYEPLLMEIHHDKLKKLSNIMDNYI